MDRHASVLQLQFFPSMADSWCGWQPVQAGSQKEYVHHNIMPEAVFLSDQADLRQPDEQGVAREGRRKAKMRLPMP